jgi:hypothetical protein
MSTSKTFADFFAKNKKTIINVAVAVSALLLVTVFVLLSVVTSSEIKKSRNLEKSVGTLQTSVDGLKDLLTGLGEDLEEVKNRDPFDYITTLATPTGFAAETVLGEEGVKWNAVPNADGYYIYVDGTIALETYDTQIKLSSLNASAGVQHNVVVKAFSNSARYDNSANATIKVLILQNITSLDRNLNQLTWAKVVGATGYEVVVNGGLTTIGASVSANVSHVYASVLFDSIVSVKPIAVIPDVYVGYAGAVVDFEIYVNAKDAASNAVNPLVLEYIYAINDAAHEDILAYYDYATWFNAIQDSTTEAELLAALNAVYDVTTDSLTAYAKTDIINPIVIGERKALLAATVADIAEYYFSDELDAAVTLAEAAIDDEIDGATVYATVAGIIGDVDTKYDRISEAKDAIDALVALHYNTIRDARPGYNENLLAATGYDFATFFGDINDATTSTDFDTAVLAVVGADGFLTTEAIGDILNPAVIISRLGYLEYEAALIEDLYFTDEFATAYDSAVFAIENNIIGATARDYVNAILGDLVTAADQQAAAKLAIDPLVLAYFELINDDNVLEDIGLNIGYIYESWFSDIDGATTFADFDLAVSAAYDGALTEDTILAINNAVIATRLAFLELQIAPIYDNYYPDDIIPAIGAAKEIIKNYIDGATTRVWVERILRAVLTKDAYQTYYRNLIDAAVLAYFTAIEDNRAISYTDTNPREDFNDFFDYAFDSLDPILYPDYDGRYAEWFSDIANATSREGFLAAVAVSWDESNGVLTEATIDFINAKVIANRLVYFDEQVEYYEDLAIFFTDELAAAVTAARAIINNTEYFTLGTGTDYIYGIDMRDAIDYLLSQLEIIEHAITGARTLIDAAVLAYFTDIADNRAISYTDTNPREDFNDFFDYAYDTLDPILYPDYDGKFAAWFDAIVGATTRTAFVTAVDAAYDVTTATDLTDTTIDFINAKVIANRLVYFDEQVEYYEYWAIFFTDELAVAVAAARAIINNTEYFTLGTGTDYIYGIDMRDAIDYLLSQLETIEDAQAASETIIDAAVLAYFTSINAAGELTNENLSYLYADWFNGEKVIPQGTGTGSIYTVEYTVNLADILGATTRVGFNAQIAKIYATGALTSDVIDFINGLVIENRIAWIEHEAYTNYKSYFFIDDYTAALNAAKQVYRDNINGVTAENLISNGSTGILDLLLANDVKATLLATAKSAIDTAVRDYFASIKDTGTGEDIALNINYDYDTWYSAIIDAANRVAFDAAVLAVWDDQDLALSGQFYLQDAVIDDINSLVITNRTNYMRDEAEQYRDEYFADSFNQAIYDATQVIAQFIDGATARTKVLQIQTDLYNDADAHKGTRQATAKTDIELALTAYFTSIEETGVENLKVALDYDYDTWYADIVNAANLTEFTTALALVWDTIETDLQADYYDYIDTLVIAKRIAWLYEAVANTYAAQYFANELNPRIVIAEQAIRDNIDGATARGLVEAQLIGIATKADQLALREIDLAVTATGKDPTAAAAIIQDFMDRIDEYINYSDMVAAFLRADADIAAL